MRKKVLFAPTEEQKLWCNEDDPKQHFTDLNFHFTRPLNPAERHEAIAHFVEGLSRLEVTDKYLICVIDFAIPTLFQMTLQSLALDRSRSLLRLIMEFRQKFPVKPTKSGSNFPHADGMN
jgi:hypothetical protein